MEYKLVIADIDGTLVPNLGMPPREFIPSQRLLKALNKAKAKQIYLSLCTGRDRDTVIKICQTLALQSPQIIEGGAKIIDVTGKILWVKYISTASINKIVEILRKTTTSFSVVINTIEIVDTVPDINLDKITAVLFYDLPKEKIEEIKKDLIQCDDIAFMVNQDRTGNTIYITNKFGTKAHGIINLLKMLNIKKEQTIGIGDGNNDKALLLESGLKVAMGNAVGEVKQIADFVVPDVNNDGVAYAIEKFVLSNL